MSDRLFQTIPWNIVSPRPSAGQPAALLALSLAEEDLLLWQSRCPHDLRSGSLMAGDLMGRAARHLLERCGAESLLYPVVETGIAGTSAPFHLVAAVPAAWDAAALASVLQTEWKRQVRLVCDGFKTQGTPTDEKAKLWELSLDHGPRVVWQLWPWQTTARAGELLRHIDAGDLLSQTERTDSWLWQANRRLLQHRWLSRWQTHDFSAGASHASRSADIPVRLGMDDNKEADKNVHAPIAPSLPLVDKSEMCSSAVLIWRITTAPGRSFLPRIASLVADARGSLLHAAVDGGVALIPNPGAVALARQFLRQLDAFPDSELSLGLALPLGAVPFARGVQVAVEAAEASAHEAASVSSLPRGLCVRVVDASRCLAEWDAGSGGPALDYAADLDGAWLSTGSSSPTKLAARLREMLRVAEKCGWAEKAHARTPISWDAEWAPGFTADDTLARFHAASQAYWTQLQSGVNNPTDKFCQWLKLLRYLTLRPAGAAKGEP